MSDTAFVADLHLRWGDLDPLNHVNNVQFARLLEEARIRAMHAWFPDGEREFAMLVARQEIEYTAPLLYSLEPARVEVWVSRLGGSSFDFAYRLRSAEGELSALAESTSTVIDRETGRPIPIPAPVREVLEGRFGDEVEFRRRR